MRIFYLEDYEVKVEPEALMLEPFKAVWDRDKDKRKKKAMKELAFLYFFCDSRSDYQYLINEEDRKEAIKKGEAMDAKWEPDEVVKKAIDFYNSFKSSAALLLDDMKFAVDKLRKMLREIDLMQTDDKGKPLYTLNTITATIKMIPQLVKEIDIAEQALSKEMKNDGKIKGNKEKSIAEDGFNF